MNRFRMWISSSNENHNENEKVKNLRIGKGLAANAAGLLLFLGSVFDLKIYHYLFYLIVLRFTFLR